MFTNGRMTYPGRLIVFEGPDGVGKTTLSGAFATYLESRKVPCRVFSFPGKEDGTLGRLVYDLHHASGAKPDPTALQLAHVAAHIDLIERQILPALRDGTCIVLDRYWWSTWVYGMVAGANQGSLEAIIRLERQHWRGVRRPTVVLLRRADPELPSTAELRQLDAAYAMLVAREERRARIESFENTGPVAERVAALAQLTADVWKPLARRARRQRGSHFPQLQLPFELPTPQVEPTPPIMIAARFSPAKTTIVYDTYWRFAAERQAIFFRRLEGRSPPWTKDAILRAHRFTNAYRASDRVSQYLIRNIIYSADQGPDDLLFRILLFKVFNKIETWRLLETALGEVRWSNFSVERYNLILDRAFKEGHRIYSAAYIMPSGGSGRTGRKHTMHLRLIDRIVREGSARRLSEVRSMEEAFEHLRKYPTIGDFLAYQFAVDINYSDLTNFDEMQFVKPGPGARDGIRKCFSDLGDFSEQDIIKVMADRQELEFARLGLKFENLWGRPLQLIDCQNLFCEVDKYARLKHPQVIGISGRTRIKQRYSMDPAPIDPIYPRKYQLANAITQWRENVSTVRGNNS